VAVTAFESEDIVKWGFDGYRDWAGRVPGLSIQGTDTNRSYFIVRGVSTANGGGNTQYPVATYIGDIPVTDTYGAFQSPDLRLFDVQSVEVLRGPQGTLFGSGAMGGAVRVLVNEPEVDHASAIGRVGFSSTEHGDWSQQYDFMGNVPLVDDSLALRFVGYYRDDGGFVDNVGLDIEDANSVETWGGRAMLKWLPNDDVEVLLSVLHQDSDPREESTRHSGNWNVARLNRTPSPPSSLFTT
jgi:outer membrane receptor protein involved in Fe transport